jgi:hypothetical protein
MYNNYKKGSTIEKKLKSPDKTTKVILRSASSAHASKYPPSSIIKKTRETTIG